MQIWGITHRGAVRQQNQDAYATQKMEDGRIIALVCDGMGGARAGNVASAMAVDLFMKRFMEQEKESNDQERMQSAAALANQEIFRRATTEEECTGMGTTLVALHTAGETWRGTARTLVCSSAWRNNLMYSGVVPQQPPNTCTPNWAQAARLWANSSGVMS